MLPPGNIRELTGVDARALPDCVLQSSEPLVLRGLVTQWPLVVAARESTQAVARYLRGFCQDATVGAMLGGPEIGGRFFYNEDLSGFNFKPVKIRLDAVLDEIERHAASERPPSLYVGSTTLDTALPGLRAHNDLDLGDRNALASIWIGNRTRIAAHHDLPDNLACVAAGCWAGGGMAPALGGRGHRGAPRWPRISDRGCAGSALRAVRWC